MTDSNTRWINFGKPSNTYKKYSSPPIGRGEILDCSLFNGVFDSKHTDIPMLYLKVEVNGVMYEGTLPVKLSEDEEE